MTAITGRYHIADTSKLLTPGYVLFRELIEQNIDAMLAIAGDASRLRPHCKTHKMAKVTQLLLAKGITKHKCATIAEAEMLAVAGATDILLAYNVVGANVGRCVEFVKRFPDVDFMITADHPEPVQQLESAMAGSDCRIGVMLDLDCGMNRTGVPPGDDAVALARQINDSPSLRFAGIHAYDGHHHENSVEARRAAIEPEWRAVCQFRDKLLGAGVPAQRIVTSGTPGFPIHAEHDEPTLELSPGTTVLYDAGSQHEYPDLPFTPAAGVLTRVISRPGENLITFDVGSKAIAADPPVERRCVFPNIPDARTVMQNEEHLVIKTSRAGAYTPGDVELVLPWHVCPTSALHKEAYVVVDGQVTETWEITSRDRALTV